MHQSTGAHRFGRVEVRPAERQLLIDGQPAPLGARAFDVLLALVERRDRAVGKNELLDLVWPGLVVEENNLQVHVSALRKLLGPQAIATIPGRGYRFTAGVDESASGSGPVAAPITPPAAAVMSAATSLPSHQGTLYGRQEDARAVGELLSAHGQVSIVGAGGIGKTRLALAVAAAQREHFPDGVWWVELGALSDGTLVASAVAQVLGVRAGDERPLIETVVGLLRKQTALLILDNCEHLLDAAAALVRALLANAPALRILLTTQEILRTPDEYVYRLSGLASTSVAGMPAAVALFVARAQATDPRLRLTDSDLSTIADVCRRLDGMPLAIELAAARVRLLGIDGVRARLDERFQVLTGGTRAVLRRHQTLRATLEWSHRLLSPQEQTVFRRLGVFVGGFTLELAQAVAADEHIDQWAVLDLLGHLVDKSLVVADGDAVPRYRLLETMRAFALEQLADAEETSKTLRLHADALVAFLTRVDAQRWTWSPEEQKRHSAELDNLRAALGWAAASAETRTLACKLFAKSWRIWMNDEMMNEGIERGQRLVPLPAEIEVDVAARFNLTMGSLGYLGGRRECFDAGLRAAELYRSLRDIPRLIDSLIVVTQVGARRGEVERGAAALAEADALISGDAPPRQRAALALAHALHFLYLGRYQEAIASAQRQAAIYQEDGLEWGTQLALTSAAWYNCALGRVDEAITGLQATLATLQRMNAPYGIGNAQVFLACAHALRGDRDEALDNGRACVSHMQRAQTVASMLPFMALVHVREHGLEANAAALVGYFDDAMARAGRKVPPFVTQVRDQVVCLVRQALGDDQARKQLTAGAALTEEEAVARAFDSNNAGTV